LVVVVVVGLQIYLDSFTED